MNSLTSIVMTDPDEKESVCAQFVIDDPADPFILSGVMTAEKEYALSFWSKSETSGKLTIGDTTFDISTEWTKHTSTFTATDDDLLINFVTAGTYYIYHLQLELGNTATDWAPAPEDAEEQITNTKRDVSDVSEQLNNTKDSVTEAFSQIQILRDQIQNLVIDENGSFSMTTQDGTGITFNIGQIQEALRASIEDLKTEQLSTKEIVDSLNADLSKVTEYVKIGTYTVVDESGNPILDENEAKIEEPCIELGEGDTAFRLRITNTSVIFFDGPTSGTEINKDGISTNNIALRGELRQNNPNAEEGSGSFVWAMRENGNYGLTWKELSS